MKHLLTVCTLLWAIFVAFPNAAQAQNDTQDFINELIGTWSLVAIAEGEDSMSTIDDGIEQLFVLSQWEDDIDQDTIYGKMLTDGLVDVEGKIKVAYDTIIYHSWTLDFPDNEPPLPVTLQNNSLIITNFLTVFYFQRIIENCSDLPAPNILGDVILCPGESSTLSVENPDQYSSFQWYKRPYLPSNSPLQFISGANSSTYTITDNDLLYYFSVEVTQDTCVLFSSEVLVDQIVSLPPFVQTAGDFVIDNNGNTAVCGNNELFFISYGLNNIQWYKDGQPIPNANDDTLYVTTSGEYTATGIDICGFPTALGVSIPVVFSSNSIIPIVEAPWCGAFAYVSNADEFVSFEWYYRWWNAPPDVFQLVPDLNNDSIPEYDNNGNYYRMGWLKVVALGNNGCISESEPTVWLCEGIEDLYATDIILYPNPAQNVLTINNQSKDRITEISLFDTNGKHLLSQTNASNTNVNINVDHLPQGIYYCQMIMPKGVIYRTFVKQ